MLKWQHLFPAAVLHRGREYYKGNQVRSLIQDGELYYAAVEGTEEHEVKIFVRKDKVTEMHCDCREAREGNRCRHMAAALYEISAREIPGLRTGKRAAFPQAGHTLIQPFDDPAYGAEADGEYRCFVPSRFTRGLKIYSDTYEKARQLLNQNALHDFAVQEGYDDSSAEGGKTIAARAYIGDEICSPVRIRFTRDRFLKMNCPVYGCKGYYAGWSGKDKAEICEHCLALLLMTAEEIGRQKEWDSTDRQAMLMIGSFRSRYRSPVLTAAEMADSENGQDTGEKSGHEVQLEPRLEDKETGLELRFRIGTEGRLYVLKDLEELTEAVHRHGKLCLGSRNELCFPEDSFEERSRGWYDLIRQAVLEKQHHEDRKTGRGGKLQSIPLYGTLMDDFYSLAADTDLEFKTKAGKIRLFVTENAPKLRLVLQRDVTEDGVFHGVILRGKLPRVVDGVRARYCLEGELLWRMEGDRLRTLEPLIEGGSGGTVNMHVGRNYLTDFYYHILPELRKDVEIEEPDREEILQYLPPEVSFRFFLDAEEGTPVCRAAAEYGENVSYAVTDWNRGSAENAGLRDRMQETAVLRLTENYFPIDRMNGELASGPDEDSVYRALTEGIDTLCRMGEVMSTSRFDALTVRRSVKVQVGVSVESELMDLKISSEDVSLAELAEILSSYQMKKKYHRLRNGDFVRLDEGIGELAELTDVLELNPKDFQQGEITVPAYRALYLEEMLEKSQKLYSTRDRHYRQLIKDFGTLKDSDYEVPETLSETLRGYQVYGYRWLRTLAGCGFGGILADEMGLGKTIQIISALLAEKQEGSIGTSLVICPASLVYNWEEEFRRFAPELSVCPVEGSQSDRSEIISRCGRWDVLVSSYDHLKRDVQLYEGKVFLYEVLDEAQFIKNQTTSAAKAVKVIRAKHRFALTGTPIENRLSELWSIFDFLMPGFLYRYDTFRERLERPITRGGDEMSSLRLKKMVSPFLLRRLKTEVLKDLPEKVEETRVVRFDTEQQKLYDAQVLRMKNILEEESDETFRKSKIRILAELTRIRQICCDPALLFENYGGGSAKLEACMDLVRSAIEGEHRVLLFSQFTSMLDLLKKRLEQEGIPYYEITGATPKKERLRLVSDFNAGQTPLFLISLRAGGTGLNLTGADIVIHYDPWWNAAAQNQATDRAHRIGQQKPVTVYKLLAKNSIEEKIQQLQDRKLSLADEIIGGEQVSFSALSREELLDLLR